MQDKIWNYLLIIDISGEGLEMIKSADDENDKDFGFDGVNLRTTRIDILEDELSGSGFLN